MTTITTLDYLLGSLQSKSKLDVRSLPNDTSNDEQEEESVGQDFFLDCDNCCSLNSAIPDEYITNLKIFTEKEQSPPGLFDHPPRSHNIKILRDIRKINSDRCSVSEVNRSLSNSDQKSDISNNSDEGDERNGSQISDNTTNFYRGASSDAIIPVNCSNRSTSDVNGRRNSSNGNNSGNSTQNSHSGSYRKYHGRRDSIRIGETPLPNLTLNYLVQNKSSANKSCLGSADSTKNKGRNDTRISLDDSFSSTESLPCIDTTTRSNRDSKKKQFISWSVDKNVMTKMHYVSSQKIKKYKTSMSFNNKPKKQCLHSGSVMNFIPKIDVMCLKNEKKPVESLLSDKTPGTSCSSVFKGLCPEGHQIDALKSVVNTRELTVRIYCEICRVDYVKKLC